MGGFLNLFLSFNINEIGGGWLKWLPFKYGKPQETLHNLKQWQSYIFLNLNSPRVILVTLETMLTDIRSFMLRECLFSQKWAAKRRIDLNASTFQGKKGNLSKSYDIQSMMFINIYNYRATNDIIMFGYIRFIHLGRTVKNNQLGSRSQLSETINLLITRPSAGNPNCVW